MLLIPLNQYWVLMMEKVHTGPYPTVISLFVNAVFVLTCLCGINTLLRRKLPALAFSQAEMLVVYIMVAISTALGGHDMIPGLVAMMAYPYQFADNSNLWEQTFFSHLPNWAIVTNREALKPLFEGNSSLYAHGHLSTWIGPVMWWMLFIAALAAVMMCINTIVRKQWIEHERLSFPIVQLPIAMTEPKGVMWKSRLFWVAFGLTFSLELVNGLSVYFPSVPLINVTERDHDLAMNLTSAPWNAIGWMPYSFYPFVVGIGYLLPADLSFSVWFFYLFWKVEKLVAATMGMDVTFDAPYIRHQTFGGLMAMLLALTWASRGYLKQVWLRALGHKSGLDDSDEPMSYRTAIAGALAGLVVLCAFMVKIGMSPLVALVAFLVYFIIAVSIARIRAELGPPVHDFHFNGPELMIPSGAGLGSLSRGDMVGLSYFWWFNRAYRACPMPIGIESMKAASATRASQRRMLYAVMTAFILGAAATFWAYLFLGYKYGINARWNDGPSYASHQTMVLDLWFRNADATALKPDWRANGALVGGFAFCTFLSAMRMRMLSWPFHPIGFVISGAYQTNLVWVPLLIAWAIKVWILRYGGLRVYRNAMPFFLGMIVGELMMGCLWGIIGISFDIPYYNFFAR